MTFIVDTSAYSAVQRGNKSVLKLFNEADHIYLPSIVEGELRAGFAFGSRSAENNDMLDGFIAQNNVSVITINEKTPSIFAEIYAELRKAGRPIGQNDLWIAALARELSLQLLTLDKDFGNVAGIKLVKI